jgi:hypothetical protein
MDNLFRPNPLKTNFSLNLLQFQNAAKELKYMDGKGNNDEFFDVDFNHPIDSTAIQRGVAAIKQSRDQHSQWTEVKYGIELN